MKPRGRIGATLFQSRSETRHKYLARLHASAFLKPDLGLTDTPPQRPATSKPRFSQPEVDLICGWEREGGRRRRRGGRAVMKARMRARA
jgi:hypothetical protein